MPQETLQLISLTALVVAALALLLSLGLFIAGRRGRSAGRTTAMARPTLDPSVAAELRRLDGLESRLAALDERARGAVQRVGVVRFNPFEDTGSNQSFALALLDARGDGVVISSLHSRQSTRIYLKSISGGKSEVALSDEEAEALRKAAAGG